VRRSVLIAIVLLLAPIGAAVALPLPPAQAQGPGPVGRTPYQPERVGIPGPELVIDVRWSGDRRGEFTEIGLLPPAFRGPVPEPGSSAFGPAATPMPLATAVPFVRPPITAASTSTPILLPPATRVQFPPPTVLGPAPR
jgi:hypothetical protein